MGAVGATGVSFPRKDTSKFGRTIYSARTMGLIQATPFGRETSKHGRTILYEGARLVLMRRKP